MIDERKKVSEAVAKAGFVAEGMEIFPASSQKQMDFIQRVIDRCDYYILIIGGRYGSLDHDGLSYTEKEFLYAKKRGIPILAFVIKSTDDLPAKKIEPASERLEKFERFKNSLTRETMVDFWSNPDELSMKAVAALAQARNLHEGTGWIRGDQAAKTNILSEINELRKENSKLKNKLADAKPSEIFDDIDLATLDEEFTIRATSNSTSNGTRTKNFAVSWQSILAAVGSAFRTPSNTTGLDFGLKRLCREKRDLPTTATLTINKTDKETILMQFEALGVMKSNVYNLKNGGSAVFHKLTSAGLASTLRANVVRSEKQTTTN